MDMMSRDLCSYLLVWPAGQIRESGAFRREG
jgi:hypothetical protein